MSPWLLVLPALVDDVVPVYDKENAVFSLVDTERRSVKLSDQDACWKLLALSLGQPISCFGEYDGSHFRPISVIHQGRVLMLKQTKGTG